MAELGVPYIMMHMRGDPGTMQSAENTAYSDVCAEVGRELQSMAAAAMCAGIEPWRIIPDPGRLKPITMALVYCCQALLAPQKSPSKTCGLCMCADDRLLTRGLVTSTVMPAGIGFAKTAEGNVALIGGLDRVRQQLDGPLHTMPLLVGPSRKGFLGKLTGTALPLVTGTLCDEACEYLSFGQCCDVY